MVFNDWLIQLRDRLARVKIMQRIDRWEDGNAGDSRSVGVGVFEMRIDYGPEYRVYYTQRGAEIIFLLCGGDKSTQQRDIDRAKLLAAQLTEKD